MTKKIILINIISILLFMSVFINISNAEWVKVTDENLNNAIKNLINSNAQTQNLNVAIANNVISLNSYKVNYNLAQKPTFTMKASINNQMSVEELEKQIDTLILPIIGYVGIENIQGISVDNITAYLMTLYFGKTFAVAVPSENSYEAVKEAYKAKKVITDSISGIDSYTMTIEAKDITETSCNLVSTLVVNASNEEEIKEETSEKDKPVTPDNDKTNSSETGNKGETSNKTNSSSATDKTTSAITLPKTGLKSPIFEIILLSVSLMIFSGIKLKKYRY